MKYKYKLEALPGTLTARTNKKIFSTRARTNIFQWKAHIVRSVNQEAAKQDQLKMIAYNPESAFLVMDWAMTFQQLRYFEKQSDWYGKNELHGLSNQKNPSVSS